MARIRIGELLVQAGVLRAEQLEEALETQRQEREKGKSTRLGVLLTRLGFVSEAILTKTLGEQLSVPWVSLRHVDFSRQLLNLVPKELVERHEIMPVLVRRERKSQTLCIAMDDPTDTEAIDAVREASGLEVQPMIASRSEIHSSMQAFYDVRPPAPPPKKPSQIPPSRRTPQATEEPEDEMAIPSGSARSDSSKPRASSGDSPDSDPDIEAHDLAIPPPKASTNLPKMIALTLLDGTTVQLPRRPSQPDPEEAGSAAKSLTAHDIVRQLRALDQVEGAGDVLPTDATRWERLMGALLSLLLKKGLIADWEFIEELNKHDG